MWQNEWLCELSCGVCVCVCGSRSLRAATDDDRVKCSLYSGVNLCSDKELIDIFHPPRSTPVPIVILIKATKVEISGNEMTEMELNMDSR